MAKQVKFFSEGVGVVPVSADPTSPAQGQLQYSDGTARAEGLWVYSGSQWLPIASGGGIISDWVSFTPTGGWTTNATYTGQYRRVGSQLEMRFKVSLSGAPNISNLFIDLPAGLTIDTSEINGTAYEDNNFGSGMVLDSGVSNYVAVSVTYSSPTQLFVVGGVTSGPSIQGSTIRHNFPFNFGAGDTVSANFSVPIVGWDTGILP